MTAETENRTHSRSAVASLIVGAAFWIYFVAILLLITQTDIMNELFFTPIEGLKNDNLGFSGLIKGLVWLVILLGVIPFAGHASGLILGLIGAIQKKRKRTFAVFGLVLNGLYFLIPVGLAIYRSFYFGF